MNKKGFTLIELMAVIVILGVLMMVAIPSVSRYIEKAKKQAFVINVTNIVKTVKSKAAYNGMTKCYSRINSIELEKGKLNKYDGFIYLDANSGNYDVKIFVHDSNTNYSFGQYGEIAEDQISESHIELFSNHRDKNSAYTINCLE